MEIHGLGENDLSINQQAILWAAKELSQGQRSQVFTVWDPFASEPAIATPQLVLNPADSEYRKGPASSVEQQNFDRALIDHPKHLLTSDSAALSDEESVTFIDDDDDDEDDVAVLDDDTCSTTADNGKSTMSQFLNGHKADHKATMAVFVHAGAGYHSYQNESVHLAMCSKATSEAMKRLKAGASAVEGVEAAIKVLENNEITNAGFGSNLSIEGMVECDATIVDHFGRSGACGAVPNIKNPISLAKLILETSSKTLSLRRVPPNFLVGDGAKQFAIEHKMPTVPNKELVSRNANDRFQRWHSDLLKARGESRKTSDSRSPQETSSRVNTNEERAQEDQMTKYAKARKGLLRDHQSAIMTGTWNEGQPDSPSSDPSTPIATLSSTSIPNSNSPGLDTPAKTRSPLTGSPNGTTKRQATVTSSPRGASFPLAGTPAKRVKTLKDEQDRLGRAEPKWSSPAADAAEDVISLDRFPGDDASIGSDWTSVHHPSRPGTPKVAATELTAEPNEMDFDLITDTMGVIVIDQLGNIAAGSSSGGIGMKHKGRTGPAALVGVGTAVIPYDHKDAFDEESKTVAAVCSGTGEHMAATMAAQKCADRLYQGTKKGPAGRDISEEDTTIVMKSFVLDDFMAHPGVRHQPSASAIGVMAVEVTEKGIYVNWAHNTDSFALASMASYEDVPSTVMSRLPEGANVTIGARKVFVPEKPREW